ncbi:MAG TPA: hypothetical protein VLA05_04520 [Coriobacteriia bacterium]|nr:hypothetical protein [Coriobacteriia bacterium]
MAARDRLVDADAVARLHRRDVTLFSQDPKVQETVADRLGWTELSKVGREVLPRIQALAEQAAKEGVTDVALLGMGGSSLASLVISRVLGGRGATMHVLDTTSPITVRHALETLDPAKTLYLVASKSGGTIEPNTLYSIFREKADAKLGRAAAGKRFIAITDPGTSLEALAVDQGFRAVVQAPGSVGGRFSALTTFGLLPAALVGADVAVMLDRAATAERACASSPEENPAVELAAFIADSRDEGADKLTVVAPEQLRTFGLWVEQLVAESLGKHGMGVVPVVELADTPRGYGPDRAIVVVRMTGDTRLAEWAQSQRGRHPVYEIVFDDAYDIAEEFVRWEYAVALTGFLLGINPFDEPNVAEAKAATAGVMDGSVSAPAPQGAADSVMVTFAGGLEAPGHPERTPATAIGHAVAALEEGDYLVLLAYLPDDEALLAPLTVVVPSVAAETGAAVCLEVGPRYLHSTGQLHKGGPNNGVFILITTQDRTDMPVPGQEWGLGNLYRAQAEGDLVTLASHDRRVLRLDLPDASRETVEKLAGALADGAGVVREDGA